MLKFEKDGVVIEVHETEEFRIGKLKLAGWIQI